MSLATDVFKAKVLLWGGKYDHRKRRGESPLEEHRKMKMEVVSKILRY